MTLVTLRLGMQIVIPFAQVEAINPNLSELDYRANVSKYFKCIVVACFSFRQLNPKLKIILVTNLEVDSIFASIFELLEVEILVTEYSFNPPPEFGDTFRGCFFLFDALRILTDDSLIIDPDVICVQSVDEMQVSLGNRIAVFRPLFSSNKLINGMTPNEANQIYDIYDGNLIDSEPRHIGGEAIYLPSKYINELFKKVSQFWAWNIERAKRGDNFLTTEEHILTVLLRNIQCESLAPFLSRIWTAKSYRRIEGELQDLEKMVMWHLPSEKGRGFQTVYSKIFESETLTGQNLLVNHDFYRKEMNLMPNFFERIRYRLYRCLKR